MGGHSITRMLGSYWSYRPYNHDPKYSWYYQHALDPAQYDAGSMATDDHLADQQPTVGRQQQPLTTTKGTVNRLACIINHRNDPRIIHMSWANDTDGANN